MKWLSVQDILPCEDNSYVLVACEGGNVAVSFYSSNRIHLKMFGKSYSRKHQGKESGYFQLAHEYGYKITHWMLLPEAPKEDKS